MKWAIARELYRYPVMPLDLDFLGRYDRTELGMGIGFHGGPVMVDLGFLKVERGALDEGIQCFLVLR